MRGTASFLLCVALLAAIAPAPAAAQPALPGVDASRQWRLERLGPDHWKLSGDVEIERDDIRFYADEMEVFTDTHKLIARGNVVFSAPTHRISADRVDFDLQTQLGTFYNASGTFALGDVADRSMFGSMEPDLFFFGETLEKIGERKYRIHNGGFTACVQPTPRWEMTSGSLVLNLDHYAFLKNMFLKVKGVPVFYLPAMYYPINKEDRATGFLIPTYGASSIRGHTISNAFFWAAGRSHDATILYDWFSKTGQGYGGEYRYLRGSGSQGDFRFYRIAEKPTEYTTTDGTTAEIAGRRSFELRGNAAQTLPLNLRGRVRLDYFSDLAVQQTYQQNIYDATRRQRYFSGNLNGAWGPYTMNASVDRSETFFSQTNSTASGAQPRLTFGYAERPVRGSIVYASVNTEYVSMLRKTTSLTTVTDLGLSRVDLAPMVRVPFSRWPFLTVNSSVAWRYTHWSKSRDLKGTVLEEPTNRTYFDMQARVVGPVFSRIWTTNSGYAEKIKHTIEPFVNLQRMTNFEGYSRIVQLDSTDYVVPGVTRVSYGLTNRLYAKQPAAGSAQKVAREVVNLSVGQTYYTDARASQVDGSYSSSYQGRAATNYSPVSLQLRTMPVEGMDYSFRAEYDVQYSGFRTLALQGSWNFRDWLHTNGSWSMQKYFTAADPTGLSRRSRSVSNMTELRLKEGRYGAALSFNYDMEKQYFLQRRMMAFYNVQCCGFAVDYQVYDYGKILFRPGFGPPVNKDKRLNISITLAGLTTFSNFLGAFGGNTQTSY